MLGWALVCNATWCLYDKLSTVDTRAELYRHRRCHKASVCLWRASSISVLGGPREETLTSHLSEITAYVVGNPKHYAGH
jgi:hypothetical protein